MPEIYHDIQIGVFQKGIDKILVSYSSFSFDELFQANLKSYGPPLSDTSGYDPYCESYIKDFYDDYRHCGPDIPLVAHG
jgi:hypothetical protein